MSSISEERVVSMRFDNKDFDKNAKATIDTLGKLKTSLSFDKEAESFKKIEEASKNVSFSEMGKNVDTIKTKFSFLQMTIQHQLNNMVDKAVASGQKIADALTIKGARDGYKEYELKMGSIQTIMAGTGEDLKTVKKYLEELNVYSDKTIYSFSDMTNNIGKFTNAGVSLHDSVKAIQGISNVAAVSGANANEASRAMYNFAQAISAGYVKLIDWKSIELANMATKSFKDELLKTAVSLGTVVKKGKNYVSVTTDANGKTSAAFNATKNFNDSLSSQWMTTEVLTKTLHKYSDETTDIGKKAFAAAQDVKTFSQLMDTVAEAIGSGWAQSWEIMVGDFEEAKKSLTAINNVLAPVIDNISNARNELLTKIFGQRDTITSADWLGLDMIDKDSEKLRSALIKVAKANGATKKEMKRVNGDFYGSLDDGWLSYDSLSKALDKYSESTKNNIGLTKSEVEELKRVKAESTVAGSSIQKLIDKFVEIDGDGTKNRKKSGRVLLFDGLTNVFKYLVRVMREVKRGYRDIFPEDSSKTIYGTLQAFNKWSQTLIVTNKNVIQQANKMRDIRDAFKGLFTIVRVVTGILGGGWRAALSVANLVLKAFNLNVMTVLGTIGRGITTFSKWVESLGILTKLSNAFSVALKNIQSIFGNIVDKLKVMPDTVNMVNSLKNAINGMKATGIQSVLTGLSNLIKIGANGIGLFIKNLAALIKSTFVPAKNETSSLTTAVKTLMAVTSTSTSGAIKILDIFKLTLVNTIKSLDSFMSKIVDFIKGSNAGTLMTIIFGAVSIKTLNSMTKAFAKLGELAGSIESIASSISGLTASLNKFVKSKVFETKTKGVLNIAIAIAALVASLWLISQIPQEKLLSSATTLLVFLGAIVGVAALSAKIETKDILKISAMMVAIGIALLGLAGAIKMISALDPKRATQSAILLGALLLALVGCMVIISKAKGTIDKGAGVLIAIAISLRLMVSSLEALDDFNVKNPLGLIGKLLMIVLAFGALSRVMGQNSKGALLIIAFSASLWLIAKSIIVLDSIKSTGTGMKNLAFIFGLLGGVLVASIAAGKNASKAGAMLLMMTTSLYLMVGVMVILGALPEDLIDRAKGTLLAITSMLAGLIAVSKLAGPNAAKAGVLLLAVAGAISTISIMAIMIGLIDTNQLVKGLAAISILILLLDSIMVASSKVDVNAIKAMKTALTVIITLAVIVAILTRFNSDSVMKSAGSLFLLMAGLSSIMASTNKLKAIDKKKAATLAYLVVIIAALGAIVAVLGQVKVDNSVIVAALAITELSIALGVMSGILSKLGVANIDKNALKSLLALSVIMLAMAGIVAVLTKINGVAGLLPKVVAISYLMATLTGVVTILSNFQGNKNLAAPIASMILLTTVLGVLTGIVAILAVIPATDGLITKVLSISALLLAMTVVVTILGTFGNGGKAITAVPALMALSIVVLILTGIIAILAQISNVEAASTALLKIAVAMVPLTLICGVLAVIPFAMAIQGALGFAAFIGILGTLIAALGGLSSIKGFDELMTSGGKVLGKLGRILGDFIGGFVSSALTAATEGLGKIGANLSMFAISASPFFMTVSTIDKGTVRAVEALGKLMLMLAAAEFISALSSIATSVIGSQDAESFGDKIVSFGDAIVEFSNKVKGKIDAKSVESAAKAGKMLAEMSNNLPRSGGWLQGFLGEKDLGQFSTNIKSFASAIVEFSKTIDKAGNMHWDKISKAAEAGTSLAKMAAEIPTTGGLWGAIAGDNDLADFGEKIVAYGNSLVLFSNTIAASKNTVNYTAVDNAAKAGTAMAKMAAEIPTTGGLWSAIAGDNDMAEFGKAIVSFGMSLVRFSNSTSDIDTNAVTTATICGKMFTALANGLPKDGSVWDVFTTDDAMSMEDFSSEIVTLGSGLALFSNIVKDVDATKVELLAKAAQVFADVQNSLPTEGWSDTSATLLDIGHMLPGLGSSISDFGKNSKGVDTVAFENVAIGTKYLADAIASLSGYELESLTKLAEIIPTVGTSVNKFAKTLGKVSAEEFMTNAKKTKELLASIADLTQNSMEDVNKGFKKKSSLSVKTITSMISKMYKAATNKEVQKKFKNAGSLLLESFKDGLDGKGSSTAITKAFESMLKTNVNGVLGSKDAKSEYKDAGKNCVIGFCKGIEENLSMADSSGNKLGKRALKSARKALKVKSPSREFMKIGEFVVQGFAKGMEDTTAESASAKMAHNVFDRAMDAVRDLVDSGVDLSPVISPVMDLSNINNGFNAIKSMSFDTPVRANLSAIAGSGVGVRTTNTDVVNAINDLKSQINTRPNNNYTINGITYDDGTNVANAVGELVRAARIERRI